MLQCNLTNLTLVGKGLLYFGQSFHLFNSPAVQVDVMDCIETKPCKEFSAPPCAGPEEIDSWQGNCEVLRMAGHLIALANDYFIEVIVHEDSDPGSCLQITVCFGHSHTSHASL